MVFTDFRPKIFLFDFDIYDGSNFLTVFLELQVIFWIKNWQKKNFTFGIDMGHKGYLYPIWVGAPLWGDRGISQVPGLLLGVMGGHRKFNLHCPCAV
jgi:hypothetical protein